MLPTTWRYGGSQSALPEAFCVLYHDLWCWQTRIYRRCARSSPAHTTACGRESYNANGRSTFTALENLLQFRTFFIASPQCAVSGALSSVGSSHVVQRDRRRRLPFIWISNRVTISKSSLFLVNCVASVFEIWVLISALSSLTSQYSRYVMPCVVWSPSAMLWQVSFASSLNSPRSALHLREMPEMI